ncbi:MAG TPA: polysaccharide deacetylase family protein [Pyrinomonadaceae bacterium]|jgi:peptidoglycan/xylan/chitin deacetylase (PgdA/CDA1 family)
MRRKVFCLAAVIVWASGVGLISTRAQTQPDAFAQQKEIAVTIDDVPLNGPRTELKRLRDMTEKLLSGIKKHGLPVVGFVNESLLYVPGETDARISLLREWADAGIELGNHTFSHTGFKTASLADYEDDFIRGDALTRLLMKEKGRKARYFRHPFLQTGTTPELEQAFESFIAERGYHVAPVTVSSWDWMFLAAYLEARTRNDSEMLKRVSEEYLKFVGLQFDFAEKATAELFGRRVKHILLLHANELNADNFDALLKVMTERGYRFITVEQALTDPVYQTPEKYIPTSDWLGRWAFSKGQKLAPPAPPEFIQKAYADAQK